MQQGGAVCEFENSDSWVILSPIEQSIKRKIEAVGTPLKDWEDFNKPKIVWGEISDRSKFAFEAYGSFIPEATTFLMVGSDLSYLLCVLNSPLSEWFFSKVGTTTGVGTVRWKKYTIQELLIPFVNVKLRQLFQQIVEKYVIGNITSEQLSKYSNKILYEVVGLIDEEIEFVEDFSKPKMLWKRVGSILRFCYNDNETLGLDSTCFATGENIEFICCVLNSPMGHYLLKDAPKTGTGDLLVSVQAIEPIQIPQVGLETNSEFKKLLESLIKTDSPSNEKEISRKVLKLYDLSLDEQSYIETNFT